MIKLNDVVMRFHNQKLPRTRVTRLSCRLDFCYRPVRVLPCSPQYRINYVRGNCSKIKKLFKKKIKFKLFQEIVSTVHVTSQPPKDFDVKINADCGYANKSLVNTAAKSAALLTSYRLNRL
jgi:hypothetical protein